MDFGTCGVEVLILQLALHTAIDRIGKLSAEILDVEVIDTATNLLIGRETNADLAVLHLGVGQQVLRCGHNLGNTRLVVSAEQRRAVGMDQRMSLEELQLGEVLDAHRQLIVELDVATLIALNHLRFNIFTTHIGCRIDVRDKANHGSRLLALRRRNRTHHVAILVHRNLGHSQRAHLLSQIGQQHLLLIGRGEGRTILAALRIVRHVFQKAFFQFHNSIRLFCG